MFLSMVHGSLLGNLTNSKMDKYLHCVGSLEKPDLWYRQQRLTNLPNPLHMHISIRTERLANKGSARVAKGLGLFKLRSKVCLFPSTNAYNNETSTWAHGKQHFSSCDGLFTSLFLPYDEQRSISSASE